MAVMEGDLAIDGVSGTAAPVRLEFTEPGGSKSGRLLPSGQAIDLLDIPGLGPIEASLIDAANPCVFVRARDLGMTGVELPDALDADSLFLERMAAIRCAGSIAMGLAADREGAEAMPSAPRVAMLSRAASLADPVRPRARALGHGHRHPHDLHRPAASGRADHRRDLPCGRRRGSSAASPTSSPGRPTSRSASRTRPASSWSTPGSITPTIPRRRTRSYGALYRTSRRLFDGHVYYRTPS